jgi:parallel beta-helix repeat protein
LDGIAETPPAAPPLTATGTSGRTFYVDIRNGSDSNDGRAASGGAPAAGPWKSLARVMLSDLGPGDTLVLACGSTWRETLRLPANGTGASPVRVMAPAAGCGTAARPTIDGSVLMPATAWQRVTGNLHQTPLAQVPLQLFAEAGNWLPAHHPNRGHDTANPSSNYLTIAAAGNVLAINGQPASNEFTTGADLVLPAGVRLAEGARVRTRVNSWHIDEAAVAAFDGRRLTLTTPTTFPIEAGWGYYLMGQLWMVDSPGEWHHSPASGLLHAWMPDGGPPTAGLLATVLPLGVDLNRRENIVVDGLVVRRVGVAADIEFSKQVILRNSSFEDVALSGVKATGSERATLESNTLLRTGVDAIDGGGRVSLAATGMTARNNLIRDSGVLMQGEQVQSLPRLAYAGILTGSNALVTGNVLINTGYIGIRVRANSLVENNFIFGACSTLDDCAGIYVWSDPGIVIRNNTVVRSRGYLPGQPAGARTQGQGIYLDESTNGALVENNTVVDADHGIQLHVARDNVIRGNRLVGNRVSQIWMQETSARINPAGDLFGNTVQGNQIAPLSPGAVGLWLQTQYASTAAFGNFADNSYFNRVSQVVAAETTASGSRAMNLPQWQQSRSIGSRQAVDVLATAASQGGYAGYTVSGVNIIPNTGLLQDAAGWSHWNPVLPAGQMLREACAAGICLRYIPGGSPGNLISPNFSVRQGQWYRLTLDISTEQDGQAVQIVVRRGGGGTNGYESLTDRALAFTTGRAWARHSMIFQATATITASDSVTGDNGARVDFEGVKPGGSVSVARLELVPVTPSVVAQSIGMLVNVGAGTVSATCSAATGQTTLCNQLYRLDNHQPVNWPQNVPPYSAVIFYGQEASLRDDDDDGIPNSLDRCPNSGTAAVNAAGCSFAQGG